MDIRQLKPARCDKNVGETGAAYAEIKIDGHRGLLHFGKELERTHLTGRRKPKGSDLYSEKALNVPHLMDAGDELARDGMRYTVLDGEITIPGHPFEAVQSVMGSNPGRAEDWQKANAWARYTVFDILFYDGRDVRKLERSVRRKLAMDVVRALQKFTGLVDFVYWERVDTKRDRQLLFDRVVGDGGEGLVIKSLNGRYGYGQRKMKAVKTFDVVITGFKPAKDGKTGKFKGLIGSVKFSAYRDGELVYVGKCSGMDDDQRLDFTRRKDWYLGQVVEVKSNGVTRHGRLRHPQFMRLRDDKAPEECIAP